MNLRAENLVFGYRDQPPVLCGVTLEIRPGRVTALFGPNGCGKSTLLRCLNGSLKPRSGRVLLGSRPVDALTASEIARRVAVVPQETPADVPFTVRQMVMLGRYAHLDLCGEESDEDRAIVDASLSSVNASDLGDRFFGQLSGGERQRVILARALAQRGEVLLLDEPASHLDISYQLELYRLVRGLASKGMAVLMVCHDILLAPLFADECVLMKAGSVTASGKAADVLCPANLYDAYGCQVDVSWSEGVVVRAKFV